jgi:hypothetical protein
VSQHASVFVIGFMKINMVNDVALQPLAPDAGALQQWASMAGVAGDVSSSLWCLWDGCSQSK